MESKMKYCKEWLFLQTEPEYIFFWGHRPSKDGTITKSCMSQWWDHPFTVSGITYPTAEHWMMAKKAAMFGDMDIFNRILSVKDPGDVKALGRAVKGFNDSIWQQNCYRIVVEGNLHKFSSDENLKDYLIGTGEKVLVEASPVDKIWGIGMAADDKDIMDPTEWRGENLLGYALMEVREELNKNK